ncbi:hypothetical protein Tcan_03740 [Toxocara canis]|uniref:Uncharacterized protein n=1 Tax=Toxocara canis TaxID=6265 RepID=A0A0B2URR8_TOXCA|nr:hypothetical protein Tcan_03740 [Toxocara canis]
MLTQFAKKMRDAARLLPKILRCHGIDQGVSWRFDEDSSEYKAICGLIHVKYLAPVCLLMKCLILGYFVAEKIYERHIILNVATLFLLLLGASSSVFLLVGIKAKKYTLVIPYFMACGVAILLVAMKSFVDLLDTANTKDTLKAYRLRKLIAQGAFLALELYTAILVWRVFGYLTDYHMQNKYLLRSRLVERRNPNENATDEKKKERNNSQITFANALYKYSNGNYEIKQLNEQFVMSIEPFRSRSNDSFEII